MIEIKTPNSTSEWEAYYDLRYRILRQPLGKERGSERNEGDSTGLHFALYENGILNAIARLDQVDQATCQARFVAVETQLQSKGFGRQIMEVMEQKGRDLNYKRLVLHARDYALPFYEKLGYTLIGPSYKLFDVLQHFEMYKNLG